MSPLRPKSSNAQCAYTTGKYHTIAVTVTVEARLLDLARERASLTPVELAQRIPIKRVGRVDRVEQWLETGELPLSKLEAIADKTHVPLGYLFLAAPPEEPLAIPDFRSGANGEIQRPSPELIGTLYTCVERQTWYREYLEENGVDEPEFLGRFTADDDPVLVAADIRRVVGWTAEARAAEPNLELVIGRSASAIEEASVLVMRNGVVGNNTHRALDPHEFGGSLVAKSGTF